MNGVHKSTPLYYNDDTNGINTDQYQKHTNNWYRYIVLWVRIRYTIFDLKACRSHPNDSYIYLLILGFCLGAKMYIDIMNATCCFYLKERIKQHPNYIYTEKLNEWSRFQYNLDKALFTLIWDYKRGVILELDRNDNIIFIGTPILIEDWERVEPPPKHSGVSSYIDGGRHGFFGIDWQRAT